MTGYKVRTIVDFHGMPVGTVLTVQREYRDWQGDRIMDCTRDDGGLIPCCWDKDGAKQAPIARDLLGPLS